MRGNVHVRFGGRERGDGAGVTRPPRPLPTRLVPFDHKGGELLFNALAQRHGRRSVLITSNLAFGEWPRVFGGDEKLTTALLDRLAEAATVITTKGKSYRMRKRRADQDGGGEAAPTPPPTDSPKSSKPTPKAPKKR